MASTACCCSPGARSPGRDWAQGTRVTGGALSHISVCPSPICPLSVCIPKGFANKSLCCRGNWCALSPQHTVARYLRGAGWWKREKQSFSVGKCVGEVEYHCEGIKC